jgi:hypothetical protein
LRIIAIVLTCAIRVVAFAFLALNLFEASIRIALGCIHVNLNIVNHHKSAPEKARKEVSIIVSKGPRRSSQLYSGLKSCYDLAHNISRDS